MMINGREQLLQPIHCVEGSYGSEFPSELNVRKIDYLQKVGTNAVLDVHSMFRDQESTENNLYSYLKQAQINQLFFTGIYSVFFRNSFNDALQKGFSVKIITDACAGTFDFDKEYQADIFDITN